ncbi:MAG: arginase family protein, partial [Gaiellaceae bacterium]
MGSRGEEHVNKPNWPMALPQNFGGLDDEFASLDRARAVVLPVPYDFSTTYQGGTRWGPRAILSASQNMELWD